MNIQIQIQIPVQEIQCQSFQADTLLYPMYLQLIPDIYKHQNSQKT